MTEKRNSPVLRFLIPVIGSVWTLIAAFYIFFAGQLLTGFLKIGLSKFPLPAHIFRSDLAVTCEMYVNFIGIWFICLAVLAIFPKNRHILKSLAAGLKGNNLKMLLVGIGIGFAANLICSLAAVLNGDIRLQFDSLQIFPLLLVFVSVFLQSGAEELVCRAYVHRKILAFGGKPLLAVLLNCVFFSLIHSANPGITPLALVNLFLLGVLCSAMVVYTDSFWAAAGVHTAWNFTQNILMGLPNSGYVLPFSVFKADPATATDSFANSVTFGPEGTVVATVVLTLSTVLVWLWHRKFASARAD